MTDRLDEEEEDAVEEEDERELFALPLRCVFLGRDGGGGGIIERKNDE